LKACNVNLIGVVVRIFDLVTYTANDQMKVLLERDMLFDWTVSEIDIAESWCGRSLILKE
jgi:hypothetical protein